MRDSSPALPAGGGPQRWQSRCKLNLVCGCWLVRSSLGLVRSEEGVAQRRAPLFSRPQSGMQFTWCPTSATSTPIPLFRPQPCSHVPRPQHPFLSLSLSHPPHPSSPLTSLLPTSFLRAAFLQDSHPCAKRRRPGMGVHGTSASSPRSIRNTGAVACVGDESSPRYPAEYCRLLGRLVEGGGERG